MVLIHVPIVQLPPLRHFFDDVTDRSFFGPFVLFVQNLGLSHSSLRSGRSLQLLLLTLRDPIVFILVLASDSPLELQQESVDYFVNALLWVYDVHG